PRGEHGAIAECNGQEGEAPQQGEDRHGRLRHEVRPEAELRTGPGKALTQGLERRASGGGEDRRSDGEWLWRRRDEHEHEYKGEQRSGCRREVRGGPALPLQEYRERNGREQLPELPRSPEQLGDHGQRSAAEPGG